MRWHVSVLVLCLLTVAVHAQAPPLPTVAAAEAEGARHPRSAVAATRAPIFATAFGTRERRCVEADTHAMARSGEFVAGPFDEYYGIAGTGSRKVWWAPEQNSANLPPLQLRATKLDATHVTVNWTLPSVARNENGYFFNTLIRFPENGKWLIVVTSGENWGCFLLSEAHAPK